MKSSLVERIKLVLRRHHSGVITLNYHIDRLDAALGLELGVHVPISAALRAVFLLLLERGIFRDDRETRVGLPQPPSALFIFGELLGLFKDNPFVLVYQLPLMYILKNDKRNYKFVLVC